MAHVLCFGVATAEDDVGFIAKSAGPPTTMTLAVVHPADRQAPAAHLGGFSPACAERTHTDAMKLCMLVCK